MQKLAYRKACGPELEAMGALHAECAPLWIKASRELQNGIRHVFFAERTEEVEK